MNTVRSYYYNPELNLRYLLITNTHNNIPAIDFTNVCPATTDNLTPYTDMFYACMDENDWLPDIYYGRLGIYNDSLSNLAFDKIISYQKNPTTDESFYKNAFLASRFEFANKVTGAEELRFVRTSEDIYNYLSSIGKEPTRIYTKLNDCKPTRWSTDPTFGHGEPIPAELLEIPNLWNSTKSDIINSINKGSFLGIYNGHGSPDGWNGFDFSFEDITYNISTDPKKILYRSNLTNKRKYPLILSMTCSSGYLPFLNTLSYELSRTENGAIAVLAASVPVYTPHNDFIEFGIIDAMWHDPGLKSEVGCYSLNDSIRTPKYLTVLGALIEQGFARMDEYLGATPSERHSRHQRMSYHIFGDPSTDIYTSVPTAFAPPVINVTDYSIDVQLKDYISSECPIYIAFYDKKSNRIERYKCGIMGNATFYNPSDSTIKVCVMSHNKIPYMKDVYAGHAYIDGASHIDKVSYNSSMNKLSVATTIYEENAMVTLSVAEPWSGLAYSKIIDTTSTLTDIHLSERKTGIYVITLNINGTSVDQYKIYVKQ